MIALTALLSYSLLVHLRTGKVGVDDPTFSADKRINSSGYWFLIGLNVVSILITVVFTVVFTVLAFQ